jgi:hypothetical protein
MRLITLITAMLIALLIFWSPFSFGVVKPEGLLLRGFESEASQNRRGMEAVRNGVLTTVRVDAAEQISATRSTEDIKPLISWYRARDQKYLAYSVFLMPRVLIWKIQKILIFILWMLRAVGLRT